MLVKEVIKQHLQKEQNFCHSIKHDFPSYMYTYTLLYFMFKANQLSPLLGDVTLMP